MKAAQERQLQEAAAEAEKQARLEREASEAAKAAKAQRERDEAKAAEKKKREAAEAEAARREEEERRRREEQEQAEEAVRKHLGQMDQQSNSRRHTIGHQPAQHAETTVSETAPVALDSTPSAAANTTSNPAPNTAPAEPPKKRKGGRPKGSKNKPKPEGWVPKPRAKPGRKSEPGPSTTTFAQAPTTAQQQTKQPGVITNGATNADADEDEDEEQMAAELEAMIAKMKRWKSKDPTVFQKLWEGMKKGNAPKPSPKTSAPTSAPQSASPGENQQLAATVSCQLPATVAVVEQQVMQPSTDTGSAPASAQVSQRFLLNHTLY